LIFPADSGYKDAMRYLSIVLSLLFLLAIITFCVNNTQEFTLSFLGYRLVVPLQLWVLMVTFFVAGMVPIVMVEIPVQIARFFRRRAVKARIRELEGSLARLAPSAGEPGKEVPDKT